MAWRQLLLLSLQAGAPKAAPVGLFSQTIAAQRATYRELAHEFYSIFLTLELYQIYFI